MPSITLVPVVPARQGRARLSTPTPPLVTVLFRLLLWPVRMLRSRREFADLAAMSDHELRDIGITRQDLRNITALPRDESPTAPLAAIAGERARTRWARARRHAKENGRRRS